MQEKRYEGPPSSSVRLFEDALFVAGYTLSGIDHHVDSLVTHATMCRSRADLKPGAFRDFVRRGSRMTRNTRCMQDIVTGDKSAILAVACDALHELIMEGV